MTERRSLSRLVRVRIFDRAQGMCLKCGLKIHAERGEKWEAMHIKSLWLGGEDAEANMAPGHVDCHKVQTKAESPLKAKGDRVRAKYLGIGKRRRTIAGRKFNGTPVPSKWVAQ